MYVHRYVCMFALNHSTPVAGRGQLSGTNFSLPLSGFWESEHRWSASAFTC